MEPLQSPPSPPHRGLLREDLLVLRRIFDLDLGREILEQDRSTTLSLGQNLPDSATKDILIVALDIEGVGTGQLLEDGQFQIGLSIFDIRHLQHTRTEHDLLQSHNFCVGSPDYCTKASRRFSFGQSEHVNPEELSTKIQELVLGRDVILVVHGGKYDILFLKEVKRSLLSALDEIAKALLPLNWHQQEEEKFAKRSQDQAKTRLEKKERKMEKKEKRKQEAHTNAATCEDDFDEHDLQ